MCLGRYQECCCADESDIKQEVLSEVEELHSKLEQHISAARELMQEVYEKIHLYAPDSTNEYWHDLATLCNLDGNIASAMGNVRKELQQAV